MIFASRIPSYSPDFSDMTSVLFRFINTTNEEIPSGHLHRFIEFVGASDQVGKTEGEI